MPDVQQRTVQLLLGQEGLLSVPIPTAIAIDLPKGIDIFTPVYLPQPSSPNPPESDAPGLLTSTDPKQASCVSCSSRSDATERRPSIPLRNVTSEFFPGHKNSTVQADDDEPTVNIQLLLCKKSLVNITVSSENTGKLPEGVTIFSPVFFPEKVRAVGDSEAIDMSPADSLERAHVDRTVSEEDEIVTQDEDELEPFLDFE